MTAEIMIIGAGASGLMAAIAAGREFLNKRSDKKGDPVLPVLVLERMDKPGKKLLATGNGRCNFSNMHMSMDCFHSDTPRLVRQVLEAFGLEKTLGFFEELGIYIKNKDGYLYPLSGQASSVLDVLLMEVECLPVKMVTGCEVQKLKRLRGGDYEAVDTSGRTYRAKRVIVACGGRAYPKLGSNGSGYGLAAEAGLKVIEPVPALTGLYAAQKYFKEVAGVRADACISLYTHKNGQPTVIARDRGEVQLTDYGVSGIPAFQVSRSAAKALAKKQKVWLTLDFMPDMTEGELFCFLSERFRRHPERNAAGLLTGMFNQKLCRLLTQQAGLTPSTAASISGGGRHESGRKTTVTAAAPNGSGRRSTVAGAQSGSGRKTTAADALNKRALGRLAGIIKALPADIVATGSFDHAQVCAGGVDGRELTPVLESRKAPGLYFVGELVDVDGICGGYNLQWAWSSGYVAGSHSAQSLKRQANKEEI